MKKQCLWEICTIGQIRSYDIKEYTTIQHFSEFRNSEKYRFFTAFGGSPAERRRGWVHTVQTIALLLIDKMIIII